MHEVEEEEDHVEVIFFSIVIRHETYFLLSYSYGYDVTMQGA
jgi:hypothetical protein